MVFTLDKKGTFLSILMAYLIFYTIGISAVLLILVFLILSSIITNYCYLEKKKLGIYDYERGIFNVLANGAPPIFFAILYYFFPFIGIGPYIGSVSSITADKFASEIGVLGSKPYCLLNFKKVKKGTSGAVSLLGTFMSFVGPTIIGLFWILILFLSIKYEIDIINRISFKDLNNYFDISSIYALKIAFVGFFGCFFDTFFGIFEEKGIGNKMTTNFICAVSGGILGFFIL